ncbi:MAG: DUF1573 domain-containing protein [Salinivirgaceae bacterium]|nr:DUF1573 domain-containing protein [Salinivirgaceae bacterium]
MRGLAKIGLLMAVVCIGCAGNQQKTDAKANGTPQINFETYEYNFGTIAQGEKVSHTFIFRNIGDGPLQITDVTTSCGCTASKYSIEPVAPGESGTVEVIFDSYGREGKQLKSANVWTNCGEKPVKLQIFAEIKIE